MKNTTQKQWVKKRDVLSERFGTKEALSKARDLLAREEQSEEAFLGSQAILILNGLV